MAGVYLHIPFCARKCVYCDFVSFPSDLAQRERYVQAVLDEIAARAAGLQGLSFDTLFVGGGTPSALEVPLLWRLVRALETQLPLSRGEWTIEANPESLTAEKLVAWREMGFDRLSIGVQRFDDRVLALLGRLHDAERAETAVRMAKSAGFRSVNVDLMGALPAQDPQSLLDSVSKAAALGADHISLYALQLEDGTLLERQVRAGQLLLPDEDAAADEMAAAFALLGRLGYERYEVSNFAKPGHACKHNLGYWRRLPYAGFGLAAHSFLDGWRLANTEHFDRYLAGKTLEERHFVDAREANEETLMLSLRMREGLPEANLNPGQRALAQRYARLRLLAFTDGAYHATDRGYEVLNSIIVDLMTLI